MQVNNSSTSMEQAAAKATVELLESAGVNIKYMVTDR
jgi:hypothetical protein